jgi:hypothetical protein
MRFWILIACLAVAGCAVSEAAKKGGVDPKDIQKCANRACFLSLDAEVISGEWIENNSVYVETYKARLPYGSTARAVMHGILDVGTLGLWEVIATPMEGSMSEKEHIVYKVYYDRSDRVIRVDFSG